jgi:hypothetical protein
MPDRSFLSLAPKVSISTMGCPQPLLESMIRDSAIRVCERTLVWRVADTPRDLSPGVSEYPYNKPANADVHAVFGATVNYDPIQRLTLDEALALHPEWAYLYGGVPFDELWSGTGTFNGDPMNEGVFNDGPSFAFTDEVLEKAGYPRTITQLTPDKFIILPLPDDEKTYTLRLIYALKPKRDAVGMPAHILDEIEEAVIHGALQELLILPNQPWTDRELATYHARQFTFKVTERRARANIGNMRGTVTARFKPFG